MAHKYSDWVHLSAELLIQKAAQRSNDDPVAIMSADDPQNLKYKIDVIKSALSINSNATGIILDGFPMSVPEAEIFKSQVSL